MDSPYYTPDGYMAVVDGKQMLFATEDDYLDYIKDDEQLDNLPKAEQCKAAP